MHPSRGSSKLRTCRSARKGAPLASHVAVGVGLGDRPVERVRVAVRAAASDRATVRHVVPIDHGLQPVGDAVAVEPVAARHRSRLLVVRNCFLADHALEVTIRIHVRVVFPNTIVVVEIRVHI